VGAMCYVPSALYGFLIPGTHDLIMKRHKPPVVLLCVVFLSGQSLSFAALPVSTIYPPVLVANPSASFVLQPILKPRHNALGGQAGPKTGDGGSLQSAASFLTQTLKTVGIQIAQDKIARYGQEHKWNNIVIMVASAAVASSVEAMEYAVTGDTKGFIDFKTESEDARGPPTNKPGILTQIKNAIGKGAGWVSDVLKGVGGAIQSVFVSDDVSNAKLTFGVDGKAVSYQEEGAPGQAKVEYDVKRITDGVVQATKDNGEIIQVTYNTETGEALDVQTIGNLGSGNYYSPLSDAYAAYEAELMQGINAYDFGSSAHETTINSRTSGSTSNNGFNLFQWLMQPIEAFVNRDPLARVLGQAVKDYFFEDRSVLFDGTRTYNESTLGTANGMYQFPRNGEPLNYFVNGISTSFNGAMQDSITYNALGRYNPSSGGLVDSIETGIGRWIGDKVPGRMAILVANDIETMIKNYNGPINIDAHSQGTVILTDALFELGRRGVKIPANVNITFNAPAVYIDKIRMATANISQRNIAINVRSNDSVPLILSTPLKNDKFFISPALVPQNWVSVGKKIWGVLNLGRVGQEHDYGKYYQEYLEGRNGRRRQNNKYPG